MTTFTKAQILTAIKHLAGGKSADVVAEIMRTTKADVIDIARHHGYPDTEKLKWAADILEKKLEDDNALDERPTATGQVVTRPAQAPIMPSTLAPPVRPDEIRILINTAKAHPSKRIQAAGDRLLDQISKLKILIEEDYQKNAAKREAEAAKAAARAEVERLEKQLAAAKAKLRKSPVGSTADAAASATTTATPADIRAWARDTGVECPKAGRIPGNIRQAYEDAHVQVAS